jgi:hypothetical protein
MIITEYQERHSLITGEQVHLDDEFNENNSVHDEEEAYITSNNANAFFNKKKELEDEIVEVKNINQRSIKSSALIAYDPKKRQIIGVKIAVLFIFATAYFYLIYYTGF